MSHNDHFYYLRREIGDPAVELTRKNTYDNKSQFRSWIAIYPPVQLYFLHFFVKGSVSKELHKDAN